MNPQQALEYFGWVPSCSCNHVVERHDDAGAGPCNDLDSYGIACECASYWAEPDETMRIEVA